MKLCFTVAASLSVALIAGSVSAQVPLRNYGELRIDGIGGNGTSLQAGGGLTVPMGLYVRLGFVGAVGSAWRDEHTVFSGRTDVIARFLLDPFRQTPFGLSLGGGVSVPYDRYRTPVRPYLTAVLDVEGRKHGRFTPAMQVGIGGGTRVGFILRAAPTLR